jgi:snRNA-activating protein complex (SNAPc), subunit 3
MFPGITHNLCSLLYYIRLTKKVHNGDVECAIFVTDRRILLRDRVEQIHQFPIIHDLWTPSYNIPECDVCQNRVAVIATSTECSITHGHVALCEPCSRQLRLQSTSRKHIERYSIWRGQADLSMGASKETSW